MFGSNFIQRLFRPKGASSFTPSFVDVRRGEGSFPLEQDETEISVRVIGSRRVLLAGQAMGLNPVDD